jgi:hypothetical protein
MGFDAEEMFFELFSDMMMGGGMGNNKGTRGGMGNMFGAMMMEEMMMEEMMYADEMVDEDDDDDDYGFPGLPSGGGLDAMMMEMMMDQMNADMAFDGGAGGSGYGKRGMKKTTARQAGPKKSVGAKARGSTHATAGRHGSSDSEESDEWMETDSDQEYKAYLKQATRVSELAAEQVGAELNVGQQGGGRGKTERQKEQKREKKKEKRRAKAAATAADMGIKTKPMSSLPSNRTTNTEPSKKMAASTAAAAAAAAAATDAAAVAPASTTMNNKNKNKMNKKKKDKKPSARSATSYLLDSDSDSDFDSDKDEVISDEDLSFFLDSFPHFKGMSQQEILMAISGL